MFLTSRLKKKCSPTNLSLKFLSGYHSECDLCCSFPENLFFNSACSCTLNTKSLTSSKRKPKDLNHSKFNDKAPSKSNQPSKQLLHYEELPTHFHELYIHTAYRSPNSTPTECLYSLFQPTNETLNVWTHLLPSIYFLYCFLYYISLLDWQPQNHAYQWPFLCCVASSAIYTLVSSMAHLFNTMSDQARHTCFFCDYAGVSLYGQCSAIACFSYSLPETWISHQSSLGLAYLSLSMCLSVGSVYTSSVTRFWLPCPSRTVLRLLGFAIPYLVDNAPILLRLTTQVSEHHIDVHTWTGHYCFAFFSVFLYASHLPERIFPGRFDVYGQSHQLFHLLGVICTTYQHKGFLSDMQSRENDLWSVGHWPSQWSTIYCISLVIILNLLIVIHFSKRAYNAHNKKK